jgi:predicted aspartyl protease
MIRGYVNERFEPILPLTVIGSNGQQHALEAIIDTGFTGALTLDSATIATLALKWIGIGRAQLADGSTASFDVFSGVIEWDDKRLVVEIEEAREPLMGLRLVRQHDVTMSLISGGLITVKPI